MTRPLPIHERIRNRRQARGIAAKDLARLAKLSPSYVSLIEQGRKVPSEEIAERIARALDDDPEIYRAWVQGSRHPDLRSSLERLQRLEQQRSDPAYRAQIRSGEPIVEELRQEDALQLNEEDELESVRILKCLEEPVADSTFDYALHRSNRLLSTEEIGSTTVAVPVLQDGADPEEPPHRSDDPIEVLELDPRMLGETLGRLFAYRPGPRAVERVAPAIQPGELVVLDEDADDLNAARIYAVRVGEQVVLSKVIRHGASLLLLPSAQGGETISVEIPDGDDWQALIAGVVILTVRSWREPSRRDNEARAWLSAQPQGRSVRVEGNALVRDCEWRKLYGWRPVQRPEDMDYLDDNPGMKMRYRLLRDGQERYVLEMSAGEWREALGGYGEGATWRRNGYVVAITKKRGGAYTEEFQDRWRRYVRAVDAGVGD